MKQLSVFIVIFMNISFIASIVACNNNPKKEKLEFYYYPDKNVYYDVANETYLYSVDGAKTWDTILGKINEDTAFLGKKEVIFSDVDSVWKDNENHRKVYAGRLYSIADDDTASSNTTAVVSERKVAKKSKARKVKQVNEEKEKKRPIKDFFKKIFGKKKKNEDKR